MEHTNAYNDQCDVEDAQNEGESKDYFPHNEFDNSITSNEDFGNKDCDDEELKRVRKEKKSRKEELKRDLVLINA